MGEKSAIAVREQLLSGTYQPQPVRRVEIPKPDGGMRKLSIPTVLDPLIQQAVMQVLQRSWDHTFSESSYGFRPGRRRPEAKRCSTSPLPLIGMMRCSRLFLGGLRSRREL